jgi:hypothetical protein
MNLVDAKAFLFYCGGRPERVRIFFVQVCPKTFGYMQKVARLASIVSLYPEVLDSISPVSSAMATVFPIAIK